jgi:hypothetical protein
MSIFTCFDEGSCVDLISEMVFVPAAELIVVIVFADIVGEFIQSMKNSLYI